MRARDNLFWLVFSSGPKMTSGAAPRRPKPSMPNTMSRAPMPPPDRRRLCHGPCDTSIRCCCEFVPDAPAAAFVAVLPSSVTSATVSCDAPRVASTEGRSDQILVPHASRVVRTVARWTPAAVGKAAPPQKSASLAPTRSARDRKALSPNESPRVSAASERQGGRRRPSP